MLPVYLVRGFHVEHVRHLSISETLALLITSCRKTSKLAQQFSEQAPALTAIGMHVYPNPSRNLVARLKLQSSIVCAYSTGTLELLAA